MQAEVVSVPTRGMERWLAQQLSTRLGVCANVDFPPPGRLVRDAVAAACDVDPDTDPWRAERSAWPLTSMRVTWTRVEACAASAITCRARSVRSARSQSKKTR
jgi:exonuclease V gamma subunit